MHPVIRCWLRHERSRLERHRDRSRSGTDENEFSPGSERRECLLDDRRLADDFEGVVDRLERLARCQTLGRSSRAGKLEPALVGIDRDDARRACQARAGDDVQADAARAEDGDALPRADSGRPEHGADTGDDARSRRAPPRRTGPRTSMRIAPAAGRTTWSQKTARVQHRQDRLAVAERPWAGEPDDVLAQMGLVAGAAPAAATRHLPADEHRVARPRARRRPRRPTRPRPLPRGRAGSA